MADFDKYDALAGALIGLARASDSNPLSRETGELIVEALAAEVGSIDEFHKKVREEKHRLAPDCSTCAAPCGRTDDYDMGLVDSAPAEERFMKRLLLCALRGMAFFARETGFADAELYDFLCEGLFRIGYEENAQALLPMITRAGGLNLKYMAFLSIEKPFAAVTERDFSSLGELCDKIPQYAEKCAFGGLYTLDLSEIL